MYRVTTSEVFAMDPPSIDREGVLARYDHLLSIGELLYKPSTSVVDLVDNGFPFEFRVTPSQKTKPAFPEDAKPPSPPPVNNNDNTSTVAAALQDSAKNSDIDDGLPEWHIAHVNGTHRVVFNKYCIYRPQYILLTASASELQTTPLNVADFKAAWTMLDALDGPHYVIFNCGKPAGGSRLHKHMQVFEQDKDELLPDMILNDPRLREVVPYKYKLQELPQAMRDSSADDVASYLIKTYEEHVRWCAEVLGLAVGEDTIPHNIILTDRWLMTIPRRQAGVGKATANSAGLIGLVWVPEDAIVDLWKDLGPTKVLAQVGVAVDAEAEEAAAAA